MSWHDAAPVLVTAMSANGCDIIEPVDSTDMRVRSARQIGGSDFAESVDDCDEETDSEADFEAASAGGRIRGEGVGVSEQEVIPGASSESSTVMATEVRRTTHLLARILGVRRMAATAGCDQVPTT